MDGGWRRWRSAAWWRDPKRNISLLILCVETGIAAIYWEKTSEKKKPTTTTATHRTYRKFNLSSGHTSAETIYCASVVTQAAMWMNESSTDHVFETQTWIWQILRTMPRLHPYRSCNIYSPKFLIFISFRIHELLPFCFTLIFGLVNSYATSFSIYAICSISLSLFFFFSLPLSDRHPIIMSFIVIMSFWFM